jgi:hypothetical protein
MSSSYARLSSHGGLRRSHQVSTATAWLRGVCVLLLPLLLGFLALAIITVHGLFVRERTPLPALAAAGATGAVILGLYRFYLGVVEADEKGTTVEFDALDAALLFGGAGTVIALATRLWCIRARSLR